MNKFKLILKGILLWATFLMSALFISGIDKMSISYIIISLIILSILYCICYKTISENEFETLTFCKYFGINIKEE